MVDAMADAFRKDQMASGHPLTHKINNKDEIDESFDEITYQKVKNLFLVIVILGCQCSEHDWLYYGKGELQNGTQGKSLIIGKSNTLRPT